MKMFQGFDRLPRFVRSAVTVGSFDGVHRGHRALIERLIAEARGNDGASIVVTFEPHPRIALGRAEGLKLLTSLEEKCALLERLGVENILVIPFDRAFGSLSAAEFIDRYLIGALGAETLVAGYNHRFGCDRLGCEALAAMRKLEVVQVDRCDVDGMQVSSTAIRNLIDAGHMAEAEHLLGHPFRGWAPQPITPR